MSADKIVIISELAIFAVLLVFNIRMGIRGRKDAEKKDLAATQAKESELDDRLKNPMRRRGSGDF